MEVKELTEICRNAQEQYALYEQHSPSKYTRQCIDHTITGCNKCLGYCRYDGHPGFLTERHIREHECLQKDCFYFLQKPKKPSEPLRRNLDLSEAILDQLQRIASGEFIKFLRVKNASLNSYTAYYVTITNDYSFAGYLEQVKSKHGINLSFEKLNYDFETCVSILCAN